VVGFPPNLPLVAGNWISHTSLDGPCQILNAGYDYDAGELVVVLGTGGQDGTATANEWLANHKSWSIASGPGMEIAKRFLVATLGSVTIGELRSDDDITGCDTPPDEGEEEPDWN
jgi:hypothetical protein